MLPLLLFYWFYFHIDRPVITGPVCWKVLNFYTILLQNRWFVAVYPRGSLLKFLLLFT